MPNYKEGKIYRIITKHSDKVYVGSTTQEIDDRFASHSSSYKLWKNGGTHYVTVYSLFELGPDDVSIELLEDVCCGTREELLARERYYIENSNSINKIIPGRTQKEYKQANKEHIKEKSVEYYNQNRDSIIEKAGNYRSQHREKIREKNNKQIICSCGGRYTVANKAMHMKSKKHFLANFIQKNLIEVWDETSESEYESDSTIETSDDDTDSDETIYMYSDYEN